MGSTTGKTSHKKTALILSGGGARGAYQVGVLKGLAEILKSKKIENPFQILSGVSAGAINTAMLAGSPDHFSTAVEKMVYLWSQIKSDQVYQMNLFSINKLSISNLLGKGSSSKFNALLDTAPLKKLLDSHINFQGIQENIKNKKYESVIITANNYLDNAAVSFISKHADKKTKEKLWNDSRRIPEYTSINVSHVMASAAIPVLFPPINIDGSDYGDGCVRNSTPCSPSLRMGADKLFVIGVRTQKTFESNQLDKKMLSKSETQRQASLVTIINTLLNAVLLDAVEQDVQRILRINELVNQVHSLNPKSDGSLKEIPALCISPSINIGELARESAHHLPRILRTSLNTFGSLDDANEIISYLMFDADFCKKLISYGYDDAYNSEKEIIQFFKKD